MPDAETPTRLQYIKENAKHFVILAAILGLLAWNGLTSNVENRLSSWYVTIALMTAFGVFLGYAITGYWRGILIDDRNKLSLSRLQILIWSLVILSALFTAILTNTEIDGFAAPLDINVPQQLWILMGISTAAAVGSPLILTNRSTVKANRSEKTKTIKALKEQGYGEVETIANGVVVRNQQPTMARWSDLLKGDEIGDAASVDVGKLQMFFFTFVLALGYCSAIASLFKASGAITALPAIQDGMNVLLAISQSGYLALKASPSSKQAPAKSGG